MMVGQLLQWLGGVDVTGVKVDLVARFIDQGWSSTSVIVPCHVILHLSQGQFGLFEHAPHPVSELVHCFHFGQWLVQFEAHPWMLASVEEEWGVLHGRVDVIIL
jgi:hypothetical protein